MLTSVLLQRIERIMNGMHFLYKHFIRYMHLLQGLEYVRGHMECIDMRNIGLHQRYPEVYVHKCIDIYAYILLHNMFNVAHFLNS